MPKGHKTGCQCGVCKAKRGENVGRTRPKHKAGCKCFCCKAGRGEFKGKNHPTYGTKNPKSKDTRKKISNTLKGKPSWNKGKKCPQVTGKNHWNWKGGVTEVHFVIRNSLEYANWRDKCRERDNYTCQICGQIRGHLEVHHIKSFSSILHDYNIKSLKDALKVPIMWDITNGVTLCVKCHALTKLTVKNKKRYKDEW